MLRHNNGTIPEQVQRGFTLVEMTVVMILSLIIAATFYTFFKSNLILYLNLQSDASNFTQLAAQSQRISSVVRGLTDITSASADDLQIYAYFFPSDAYVSQVHYYLNANKTQLLADVTQMTANPPVGSPIPSSLKTYTIIDNFKQSAGTDLFVYSDASNTVLPEPISDLTVIKAIKINLAVSASNNNNQIETTQVSLRNRKVNL